MSAQFLVPTEDIEAMASALAAGVIFPLLLRANRRRCLLPRPRYLTARSLSSARIHASVSSTVPAGEEPTRTRMNSLACPICYSPLVSGTPDETKEAPPAPESCFVCSSCRKSYAPNEAYIDLTVSSGFKAYAEVPPLFSELFRTPLVSFLYERGWRQNFVLGGFPGPEKEFEMAKEYLKPTVGGTIIDASCGSGLFSRLFAKSRLYSLVVALDFSENMLRQCNDFVNQEGLPREDLVLVRADIARLPFVSSSVDAVHAGAALHCWPSPSAAIKWQTEPHPPR